MSERQLEEFWNRCERWGPEAVSKKITAGTFRQPRKGWAEQWLEKNQRNQDTASVEQQETRKNEALEIARESNIISTEANELSKNTNKISIYSFIIALFSLLIACVALCSGPSS